MQINDESGDKKYFTIIPNYILNHSTMYDREVYIQMKRVAGENGTCWMSQSKLSEQCGLSVNRLKKSLKYLKEHNWIKEIGAKKTDSSGGKQKTKVYQIIDLWDLNNKYYKGVSSNDTPKVKGVSPDDTKGYHQKATKKNHVKKNNIADIKSAEKNFNQNKSIQKMRADRNAHIRLIGWYFEKRGSKFPSESNLKQEIKRWCKDATFICKYPQEQVAKTHTFVSRKFPEEWNLSTIRKYISEIK